MFLDRVFFFFFFLYSSSSSSSSSDSASSNHVSHWFTCGNKKHVSYLVLDRWYLRDHFRALFKPYPTCLSGYLRTTGLREGFRWLFFYLSINLTFLVVGDDYILNDANTTCCLFHTIRYLTQHCLRRV